MIKLFTGNDYSAIVSLWQRSVEATHHFLLEDDLEFYKTKVSSYFPSVKDLYIYEEDGFIKAFLGVSDDEIDMLFADPQYIGKGIGKQLLRYALDDLNLKKIDVNEQNTHAFEFYKHFGFRVISRSETDGFGKSYPILHLEL